MSGKAGGSSRRRGMRFLEKGTQATYKQDAIHGTKPFEARREDENSKKGALLVTPTHQPIYVKNDTYVGWKDTGDLSGGGHDIRRASNELVAIYSLDMISTNIKVYSLMTDWPNNFIANGFLLLDKGGKRG